MQVRNSLLVTSVVALASCRGLLALDDKVLVDAAEVEAGPATDGGPVPVSGDAGTPVCPSSTSFCGAGCVSIATDLQNCGRCGRACSTSCEAGSCEPRVVTDVGPGALVYGLADGQSYLYWTTDAVANGAIRRVSKLGGTPEPVASPGGGPTGIIVVHPDELYVATQFGQTIDHVLAGTVVPLATGQSKAANIVLEGETIYFTRYAAADGDVRSIPRDGGLATVVVPNMPNALGIATDATHLYFTTNNTAVVALWSALKDGGAVTKLLDTNVVGDVGLDDNAIYSSDTNAGLVVRIDKLSGAIATLAVEPNVQALALDPDSVFWVSADGVVGRAPKGGGPKTVLASKQAAMQYHMVVDDTDVYWVAADRLWAVPK